MNLSDEDLGPLLVLLSPERLSALKQLTGSDRAAIELHQETLRVGALLMNVTATIEIALRNAVCENLSAHFGTPNWFINPPAPFAWRHTEQSRIPGAIDAAQRAAYSKLTQAEKAALDVLAYPNGRPAGVSHLRRAKDRRHQIVVTEGKVIAEITLHFWKKLYGPEYEQDLWRTSLKRTFPEKTLKRADVASQLEHIYQARNRLAHHEPVLHRRFDDTVKAIEFVAGHLNFTPAGDQSPLTKLIAPDLDRATEKAAALHAKLEEYRVAGAS